MAEQLQFSEIRDLVGKRSDDPAVLAFHAAHKLPPPPVVMRTGLVYDVHVGKLGVSLDYGAELRTPQHWPPRRVAGRYVAYVTSATFKPTFPGLLANGLSPTLPLTTAKNKAIESTKNEAFYFNVMHRDDRYTLTYVYDRDDKTLLEIRLQLNELPEDHKALKRAAEIHAAKQPAHAPRVIPERTGSPETEPLPPALAALAKLIDDEGGSLGENIDLEMCEQIESGTVSAWTNNPDAERELRIFAQDGSGGVVAFWLVHADRPYEEQPIVFLGSEGEIGPIACDLADFLYLLAGGVGPYEAIEYGSTSGKPTFPKVAKLAATLAKREGRTPVDVLAAAADQYLDIHERIAALIRNESP
ncbi:MAG: hypothetical protein H0T42_13340 [Deltaproteobacteria bacterium]|nr:hypothetical protein [Deltaproteobacteria bacterium]